MPIDDGAFDSLWRRCYGRLTRSAENAPGSPSPAASDSCVKQVVHRRKAIGSDTSTPFTTHVQGPNSTVGHVETARPNRTVGSYRLEEPIACDTPFLPRRERTAERLHREGLPISDLLRKPSKSVGATIGRCPTFAADRPARPTEARTGSISLRLTSPKRDLLMHRELRVAVPRPRSRDVDR